MALIDANVWLLSKHPHIFSEFYGKIPEPQTQDVVPIDTFLPIASLWETIVGENFSISPAGIVTFTGANALFLYAPSVQFFSNKACNLVFETRINGISVSQTPFIITSTNTAMSRQVTRMALIPLNTNDTLQIFVKSDTASTTLTWQQATIVIKG